MDMETSTRKFTPASLELLQRHSLFSFHIQEADVDARVQELKDLIHFLASSDEPDQYEILYEQVQLIQDDIIAGDGRESYLLASLQHFTQQMEMLLLVEVEENDEPAEGNEEEIASPLPSVSTITTPKKTVVSSFSSSSSSSSAASITDCFKKQTTPAPAVATPSLESKIGKTEEEDVRCGVCLQLDSTDQDPIVLCDLCGTAVHQTCYRIAALPDGDWFCQPCTQYLKKSDSIASNVTPTHELVCVACHEKAGAFVPTSDSDWVHVACSMFLPELFVQTVQNQEVIAGVDKLKVRRKLRCCFCKKNDKGACAQCMVGKCTIAYHPLCALRNGIKIAFMEDKQHFGSGCLTHQNEFLSMEGLNAEEDEEAVETPVAEAKLEKSHSIREERRRANGVQRANGKNKKEKRRVRKHSWTSEDSDTESSDGIDLMSDVASDDEAEELKTSQSQCNSQNMKNQFINVESVVKNSDRNHVKKVKKSRQTTLQFGIPSPGTAKLISGRPIDTPSTANSNRLVLHSSVFQPAFYPQGVQVEDFDKDHNYVMVLVTARPLGMIISTKHTSFGSGVFLDGKNSVSTIIREAIEKDVIRDGDELFAMNNTPLRNLPMNTITTITQTAELPLRCWFRTRRRHQNVTLPTVAASTVPTNNSELLSQSVSTTQSSSAALVTTTKSPVLEEEEGLSVDWPWSYLRSDGKVAMNLFWKSLDGVFFLQKITPKLFSDLQNKLEATIGVRLNSKHPDYQHVRDFLAMPKRERLPSYLVDFRKNRKQKQTFLSSDIFVGVNTEAQKDEDEVDEGVPIAIGTTVTVAKRTWPGINKLGGAGRVKKVNEETLNNGKKRYTYNIGYVLGGGEKNVERKYISVVDLSKDAEREKEPQEEHNNKTRDEEHEDAASAKIRASYLMTQHHSDTINFSLPIASASPKSQGFHVQISTTGGTVFMQRKLGSDEMPKELLLHKHFEVKLNPEDAAVNDAYKLSLTAMEERSLDSVDDSDEEEEDEEEDVIKKQLEALQQEFSTVVAQNEQVIESIRIAVEEEYATKSYRTRALEQVRWLHYEQMYRDIAALHEKFDDSDDENDEHGGESRRKIDKSEDESDSDEENEDESCGGLFVNKIKQEGNEVCVLCELSGGDFAATACGNVVHPQCAMFTPETFFQNGVAHGIDQITPERRKLVCAICSGRKGLSKIQCANKKCSLSYHIACAYVNGLLTRDPYYQAWCPKHMKTSGMADHVELPKHLQKRDHATYSRGKKKKSTKPNTSQAKKGKRDTPQPRTVGSDAGEMSSSKTTRKRKRRNSSHIEMEDEKTDEPPCARRLVIDVDSEEDPRSIKSEPVSWRDSSTAHMVFKVGDVVEVQAREWKGINKPGGVARVKSVHVVENVKDAVMYDVAYVVGNTKERYVEAKYVRLYQQPIINVVENVNSLSNGVLRKKSRTM